MKREDLERNQKITPLAKLITEWLARRDAQPHSAKQVADGLGVVPAGLVCDEAYAMRRLGLLLTEHGGDHLPYSTLMLSPETRAAYVGEEKKKR